MVLFATVTEGLALYAPGHGQGSPGPAYAPGAHGNSREQASILPKKRRENRLVSGIGVLRILLQMDALLSKGSSIEFMHCFCQRMALSRVVRNLNNT